jgi:hypothetical protein
VKRYLLDTIEDVSVVDTRRKLGCGHLPEIRRDRRNRGSLHIPRQQIPPNAVIQPNTVTSPAATVNYSTVTDFARLRGWSTSVPSTSAVWYARSCNGNAKMIGATSAGISGRTSVTQGPLAASAAPF